MKARFVFALTALAAFFLSGAVSTGAPIAIVPKPVKITAGEGVFTLNNETKIVIDKDSADAANVARQLVERIKNSTGYDLAVVPTDQAAPNAIRLTSQNANPGLGNEGYSLECSPGGATISAIAGPGLFYGSQTLLQLFPPEIFSTAKVEKPVAWTAPAVKIDDKPRFGWRGLMLDVSRHFFNKDEIKNYIDLMAQHKLNTFHWHLVDDTGCRIEIKRYPKVTDIGAWRKDILFDLDPKDGTAWGPDGRYGGFYTQADIREIVAYAKDRYITIVPEIEMPGHAGGVLAGYPECTCAGKYDGPDTKMAIYCAGNDASFELIEGILREVIDLFPGKYIHIGGDEVDKANWKKCEKCQARIKKEGLKDEAELQSYFVRRVEKFLNANGRTLIGWDEILEGGLAPNATVMSWRGTEGGINASKAGHDVVMTPTSHCYFDYYQAKSGEPKAIGGFLPLEVVYAFDPLPKAIDADKAHHVLGADGNLWTEFVPNYRHAQYMTYPRACAMAEVTWTEPSQKDWNDFQHRLETHLARLKAESVNYRTPGGETK